MTLKIKPTQDGSTTIYHSELDENYHSIYGAIQEAQHVYINAGFQQLQTSQHRILEVGFGTGLNALLTCEVATQQQKRITYHTLEKYPLNAEMVSQLDFGKERKVLLEKMHQAAWETPVEITPYFNLLKTKTDLLHYEFTQEYDLIYYDAFAPDKQPEIWQPDVLTKVATTLAKDGILTTYSTKGTVKQAFRDANLFVKRLKGPVGKRDMLQCRKIQPTKIGIS